MVSNPVLKTDINGNKWLLGERGLGTDLLGSDQFPVRLSHNETQREEVRDSCLTKKL